MITGFDFSSLKLTNLNICVVSGNHLCLVLLAKNKPSELEIKHLLLPEQL